MCYIDKKWEARRSLPTEMANVSNGVVKQRQGCGMQPDTVVVNAPVSGLVYHTSWGNSTEV